MQLPQVDPHDELFTRIELYTGMDARCDKQDKIIHRSAVNYLACAMCTGHNMPYFFVLFFCKTRLCPINNTSKVTKCFSTDTIARVKITPVPFQDDFRSALAEDAEACGVWQSDDGAHRLSNRVESVDFKQVFFGRLVPVVLVLEAHVVEEAQKSALRFVADLLRQICLGLRWLSKNNETQMRVIAASPYQSPNCLRSSVCLSVCCSVIKTPTAHCNEPRDPADLTYCRSKFRAIFSFAQRSIFRQTNNKFGLSPSPQCNAAMGEVSV